ncbi:unnamed protein product [Moneuplotes crassus]|uniref:Uncharacterized protein n=1 Tax=Euplotes crassus TaxID=5936 RepID=A0AAD1XU13_EUPCR|nr:unnamed protein product [Moneuplotes crassus]
MESKSQTCQQSQNRKDKELKLHCEELDRKDSCNRAIFYKHEVPKTTANFFFRNHYSLNFKYIKDLCFTKEIINNYLAKIFVSKIRPKYAAKMLNLLLKNQSSVEIDTCQDPSFYRQKISIDYLIKTTHSLKRLDLNLILMNSKQFVNIFLGGVNLEYLKINDCFIFGPQLSFSYEGTTSKLKNFDIQWEIITLPEHLRTNLEYYDNLLTNLSQCPCSKTLAKISVTNSKIPSHLQHSLLQTHCHLKITFCPPYS